MLLVAAMALLGAAPDAGTPDSGTPDAGRSAPVCPPVERVSHCVYFTLRTPEKWVARRLQRTLKREGVAAEISEDLVVSATLDDERLRNLLDAKVRYRLTEGSASPGMRCTAEIVRWRAPERYQEIRSVRIDPQCP
jgi:hypothetical protein